MSLQDLTSPSAKPVVTFVAYGPNQFNGPNNWLQRILPLLVTHGFTPRVVFLMNSEKPCAVMNSLLKNGIDCEALPRHQYTEDNIVEILSALRRNPPAVFVPNLSVPAYFAAAWLKEAGIPSIGVIRSDDNFHHELIEYFASGEPRFTLDAMVCKSKFLLSSVSQANPHLKTLWSPSGTPKSNYIVAEPTSELRLVYTGRLIQRQKRIFHVIEQCKSAIQEIPGIYATIYGEDREQGRVVQAIENAGVGSALRYGGLLSIDEVLPEISQHHVFVLLSEYEGLSSSLMEAMGCGLVPVVTRTRSGIDDLVRDGENGLIVDDSKASFVGAINRLKSEPGLWKRLSQNARQTILSDFTSEAAAMRWANFLDDLLRINSSRYCKEIGIPSVDSMVLPARKTSENGTCREDKRRPKKLETEVVTMQNAFLSPEPSKENVDLYLVRSSILKQIKKFASESSGVLLDVGCGQMPYRSLFEANPSVSKYIGLDIENPAYQRQSRPDMFWDGKSIPLENDSVDCVVSTEVFEHVPDLSVVLKEIRRVLRPDGKLFFTVPFLWPLHDTPYDEFRYTPFSLQRILEKAGFSDIEVEAFGGWHASMAQMMGLWLKRAPMSDAERAQLTEQLYPLYQQLVELDEAPKTFTKGTTMITGLYGRATAEKEVREQPFHTSVQKSEDSVRLLLA